MRHHRLYEAEVAHLQDIGVLQNHFWSQCLEIAATSLAGVVDQHIDAAPSRRHLSDESLDPFAVGHVHRPGDHCLSLFCQLSAGQINRLFTACTDRDASALSSKGASDGQANPP